MRHVALLAHCVNDLHELFIPFLDLVNTEYQQLRDILVTPHYCNAWARVTVRITQIFFLLPSGL